jgi:protein-tyrosine phosphatase
MEQQTILRLGGVRNLRDVGGHPTRDGRCTRWRVLYRSDCLDRLDEAGQARLIDAGLHTVIDIRGADEIAERPSVFAGSPNVAYRHFPLWQSPPPDTFEPDLRRGYRREMDLLGERLVQLVEMVIQPGVLPALINCAAGKDRTGVAIGVMLAAVETEPQAIAADYALSQACLGANYRDEVRAWVTSNGWEWSAWEHTVQTPPERMLLTLDYLNERYGGVRSYLLERGLPAAALDDLRALLTEDMH